MLTCYEVSICHKRPVVITCQPVSVVHAAMLHIRSGNTDNLGIISHISPVNHGK